MMSTKAMSKRPRSPSILDPRSSILLLVGAAIFAPVAGAQERLEREAFTWAGRIPDGRWITVRNLRGNIEVTRGGDKVEVIATRRTRRGDPNFVTFTVDKFGSGDENVLVCALWGDNSSCTEDSYRSRMSSSRMRA